MTEINLIGGFYLSKTRPWAAQDVVNWVPVKSVAGGTRSPYKLRGLPGLRSLGESVVSTLRIIGDAPSGVVGDAYSFSYTASGGTPPYSFGFISGELPPGLSFSSGTISGFPTTAGVSEFRVGVTDSVSQNDQKNDAITITAPPAPGRFFVTRVIGGAPSSVEYVTTTDPSDWETGIVTPSVSGGDYQITSSSAVGGIVVMTDSQADNVFTSLDNGSTWQRGSMPTNLGGSGKVVYDGAKFILPGQVGGVANSSDGVTFSTVNTIDQIQAAAVCGDIIVGTRPSSFAYSKTRYSTNSGVSWTQSVTELGIEQGWGNVIVFGDGSRVLVHGYKGGIFNANIGGYTENGNTFVSVSSPFANTKRSTCGCAGGDIWVMGADDGTIAYSSDRGASWAIASGSLGVRANDVAFAGGVFAMVGNGGVLKTSTDGNTWTARTTSFGSSDLFTITAIQ